MLCYSAELKLCKFELVCIFPAQRQKARNKIQLLSCAVIVSSITVKHKAKKGHKSSFQIEEGEEI